MRYPLLSCLPLLALAATAQVSLIQNEPPHGTYPQALFQGGCMSVNNDRILCGGIDVDLYQWDGTQFVWEYTNQAAYTEVALGDDYFAMAPWTSGYVEVHDLATKSNVATISASMYLTYIDAGDHMAFSGGDLALFMGSSEIRVYTEASTYASYVSLTPPGGMSFNTLLGTLDADATYIATVTTDGRVVTYSRNTGSWSSPNVMYSDPMTTSFGNAYYFLNVAVHDDRTILSGCDINADEAYVQVFEPNGSAWDVEFETDFNSLDPGTALVGSQACFDGDQVFVSDIQNDVGVVRIFKIGTGMPEVTPSPAIDEGSTATTYRFGNDGMDAGGGFLAIGDPMESSIGEYWFYRTHECVQLEIQTDNNPTETEWTISGNGFTTSGGGSAYSGMANTSIFHTIYLPPGQGCYSLDVEDSGNDGMTDGTNGGYILRTCSGDRIIDNDQDGFFAGSSSTECGNDFCLPLSPSRMDDQFCDMDPYVLSRGLSDNCDLPGDDKISAVLMDAVTTACMNGVNGYRYQIFDPDGLAFGQTWSSGTFANCVITSNSTLYCHSRPHTYNNWAYGANGTNCERYKWVHPNSWGSNIPPINVWLNIRVAPILNNVTGNYGPVCRIRFVPPSQLMPLEPMGNAVELPLPELVVTGAAQGQTVGVNVHSLEAPDGMATLEVTDMYGRMIYREQVITGNVMQWSHNLVLPEISTGIYVLSVSTATERLSERFFRE